jgi:hypothetical protein
MKKKKQRYCLVFHARPDEAVSAEEKYARFFTGIKDLPAPWGLGDRPVPPAEKLKRKGAGVMGLDKFFGDGVKRAMMNLEYRHMLEDKGSSDDALIIDFDPAKVDVHHLIYTVIPCYIEAFDAYRVDYYDEEFVHLAWETPPEQRVHTDPRSNVNRVDVVGFYDELLCRRAFNLSPADVLERVQGKIEHGRLLHNGVYLVGSSQVPPFDEAQQLCREMTTTLRA